MNDSRPLLPDLLRWSVGNAAAMAGVTLAIAAGLPHALISLTAVLSFAALLYLCWGRWTPAGRFGPANTVCVLRVCAICILPWIAPWQIVYWGLILMAMDGLDGWVARRTGLSGEFGEFFDKESDAYFMLMLCVLLYRLPGGPGAWVLVPGLLRYLFVLFVTVARPPELKEQRSVHARWISFFMMFALLLCFAAYPGYLAYCLPLTALMTVLLVYSFAASLYTMYRPSAAREKV